MTDQVADWSKDPGRSWGACGASVRTRTPGRRWSRPATPRRRWC